MSTLAVFVLLVGLLQSCVQSCDDNLKSVIVLYRYGDRAPLKSYKNDLYNETQWPFGFGELTNVGKNQHYALGQWLRARYASFLSSKYKKSDIKVFSSNMDRCLMSAASNLAGLYPPVCDQIWNTKLHWQPLPIHTAPEDILAQGSPCPKHDKLYNELLKSVEIKEILSDSKHLFEYLSQHSGEDITTLVDLQTLYNILSIQDFYDLTLPAWAKKVFSGELFKSLSDFTWSTFTFTPDLARLKAGPLIDLITTHFENVTCNPVQPPKLLMLSGHDSTVASLLNALRIFDGLTPPYASTVILELRKNKGNYFVNIFYKKFVTLFNLTLPDCDFSCNLKKFKEIVQPLRINSTEWRRRCRIC